MEREADAEVAAAALRHRQNGKLIGFFETGGGAAVLDWLMLEKMVGWIWHGTGKWPLQRWETHGINEPSILVFSAISNYHQLQGLLISGNHSEPFNSSQSCVSPIVSVYLDFH